MIDAYTKRMLAMIIVLWLGMMVCGAILWMSGTFSNNGICT